MTTSMGRPCSVCSNPSRSTIDAQIVAGTPLRKLARDFGLSAQALARHRDSHLGREIRDAAEQRQAQEELDRGGSLLDQMLELNREARVALRQAKASKDIRRILAAIATTSRLLELQAKLEGEIGTGGVTNISITHNDFRTLQISIVEALAPYPAARQAVLRALGSDVRAIEADG